jgi:hypothetical protein
MAKQPEQFNPHPTDVIRKELDAKIDRLDVKIDNKVSNHVFYWVLGILISILVAGLTGVFAYINKISDKQNSMNERLIHVEAKTDRADSINDRLVRIETQVESIKSKRY